MEKIIKEGKILEDVLIELLEENNLNKEDLVYTSEKKKGKLFKGETVEVTAYLKKDIYEEIKTYLTEIITNLGLEVNFEIKNSEERTTIKMYSDNNPILIGRNGQTIKALETLVKQMIQAKYNIHFKVSLDVENYKQKKQISIERMATRVAREVADTKVEARLENMTSYERRIVHNILTNFKGVKTESEGEEPNRHIVIKHE